MTKCKVCSKTIHGRSDKKFCSVRCKNYYHVNLRKVTNIAVRDIDEILHRNRSILLELMGKNSTCKKIPQVELDKRKFNYKYHTHFINNHVGKTYFYVYDFAWMKFSDDKVLLIRKK